MDLYNGWFNKNGGCGFVMKPGIMREEIAYFSANTKDVIPGVSPQILHVKVSYQWLWVCYETWNNERGDSLLQCQYQRCHTGCLTPDTPCQGELSMAVGLL